MYHQRGDDSYWQCGKSLRQCLESVFHRQSFCDVIFALPNQHTIGAHRSILACRSPVFAAMMKSGQFVISISDVEIDSFRDFLRYLYTDEVEVSAGNIGDILYLAEKYLLENLKKICVEHMLQTISLEHVVYYFELSYFYNIPFLQRETSNIIKHLPSLLLNVDEYQQLPPEVKEFIELELCSDKHGSDNTKYTVDNPALPRSDTPCDEKFQVALRFKQNQGPWQQENNEDAIAFKAESELQLGGVLMYGSLNRNDVCQVRLRILDDTGSELQTLNTILSYLWEDHIYMVYLPEPITILPDREYTVISSMDVAYCYKGFDGLHEFQIDNVNVMVMNTPRSKTGTTKQRGQIPGLLLRRTPQT